MSATDDASRSLPAGPAAPRRTAATAIALAAIVAGAALALAFGPRVTPIRLLSHEASAAWRGPAPDPESWAPGAPPGVTVKLVEHGGRSDLVVRAPDPGTAVSLARTLVSERASGRAEWSRRRSALRVAWRERIPIGPLPVPSARGDCAALLRGWAEAWRGVAGDDPTRFAPATEPARGEALRLDEADAAREAVAGDPAALERALVRSADLDREQLRDAVRGWDAGAFDEIVARWRNANRRRAEDLESIAVAIESDLDEASIENVRFAVPGHALDAERRISDPSTLLQAIAQVPATIRTRPRFEAWLALAAVGALLGFLLAWPLVWRLSRHHEPPARQPAAPRSPAQTDTWLHILSGPSTRRTGQAALVLSSGFLERGKSVLIIDGAPRSPLHRCFDCENRLGLDECLAGRMPLLGVLQSSGVPGLFFLSHGGGVRATHWTQLDRLLEEARPHFGHVILSLDPSCPREIGSTLAGRVMDGWWTGGPGPRGGAASRVEARIGIALSDIELPQPEETSLEALRARFVATTPLGPSSEIPSEPGPEILAPRDGPPVHSAPVVLDCDLQVRERLRFLVWMRRVQAEGRGGILEPLVRG
jgi:hypothetical protein